MFDVIVSDGDLSDSEQITVTVTTAVSEPEDVTNLVAIDFFGQQYNRRTGVYGFYAAITNTSAVELQYPAKLRLTDLGSVGTTVRNADGIDGGVPYFLFEGTGTLAPGQTSDRIVIAIQPPYRQRYTFVPLAEAIVVDGGGRGPEGEFVPATTASFTPPAIAPSDATLHNLPMPSFQNVDNKYDVNADGLISALDALNVINHLNAGSELIAADLASVIDLTPSKWVDVNADGNVTALDALTVINALNTVNVLTNQPLPETSQTQVPQVRLVDHDKEIEQAVDDVYATIAKQDLGKPIDSFEIPLAGKIAAKMPSDAQTSDTRMSESDSATGLLDSVLESELVWKQ